MAEAPEIGARELAARLERGEVALVDVREPDEWNAGRIAGALHLPLGQLGDRAAEVPAEGEVVFYCHTGARSAMATEAFRAAGVAAWNLEGGIVAWEREGLPLDPEGAQIAPTGDAPA